MKRKLSILFIVLGLLAIIIGLIIVNKDNIFKSKNNLEIIDATYSCDGIYELFYEDNNYKYYFPCTMSKSVFVKIDDTKYLVVDALDKNIITIDQILDSDLNIIKNEK